MSKPIKMTEKYLEECRKDFEKALKLTKLADGKLSFTKTFTLADKKAVVYFTPEAWAKMVMLINEFDKEVAWHGVASRAEDESKDEYIISDILVYPQEVSGASVEMDTGKYATWLMENVEDERFNNIHMQGHSHVKMSTSPSGVDLSHQEEILNMLGDEDFYIFMIWNKSFVSTNKVYDLKKNILFEDKDVTVKIFGGTEDLDAFLKSAKEMVKTKTYTYTGGNSGYSSQATGVRLPSSAPYNPLPASTKPDEEKKEKPRTKIGAGYAATNIGGQQSMFNQDDYEDVNWPHGYGGYYGYGR